MRNYTTVWHATFTGEISGGGPYPFDVFSDDFDDCASQAFFIQGQWIGGGGSGSIDGPNEEFIEIDRELVCACFGVFWRSQAVTASLSQFFGLDSWNSDLTSRLTDSSPKQSWSNGK